MSISVIIPSALKAAPDGESWLARALRSVAAQTLMPAEVLVGIDPEAVIPGLPRDLPIDLPALHFVRGARKGHQAACNAAAAKATGRLISFLEDDDEWRDGHLEILSAAMDRHGADLVTTSQQEVTPEGEEITHLGGLFHFPTCSGWLVTRLAWLKLGGFSLKFRIHHDNEWLSRFNEAGLKRIHLVPEGTDLGHPWLGTLAMFSPIEAAPGLKAATVLRTVHPESIMAAVSRGDGERKARSQIEYAALVVLHNAIGW